MLARQRARCAGSLSESIEPTISTNNQLAHGLKGFARATLVTGVWLRAGHGLGRSYLGEGQPLEWGLLKTPFSETKGPSPGIQ
jgi:hypothetical protein